MKQNNNRRSLKPVVVADRQIAINMNTIQNGHGGKISNGNVYNSVATDEHPPGGMCNGNDKLCKVPYCEPKDSIRGRDLPDIPRVSDISAAGILVIIQSLCSISMRHIPLYHNINSPLQHTIFCYNYYGLYIRCGSDFF